MNLQGRDLKLDLRGDDVALLHHELAIMGVAVPDAERRETLFGQGLMRRLPSFRSSIAWNQPAWSMPRRRVRSMRR